MNIHKIKKIIVLSCLVIAFLFFGKLFFGKVDVFGQRPTEDYLYQYEQYRNTYQDFVLARDKYLQYQTLATKDEALEKTKAAIGQLNKLLQTYLIALKDKVSVAVISPITLKDKMVSELGTEISWLEGHETRLNQIVFSDSQRLFGLSAELKAKKPQFYKLMYQSLILLELDKNQSVQQDLILLLGIIDKTVNKQEDKKLVDKLIVWVSSAREKNRQSEDLDLQARDKLNEMNKITKIDQLSNAYQEAVEIFKSSFGKLKESLSFQKEIFMQLEKAAPEEKKTGS